MDIPLSMGPASASATPESRFEELYAQYYGRVLGYVLRRDSAAGAADVVADVFLVAWRRLDQVPDDPLPWLLAVARKTLANQRRGRERRVALGEAVANTLRTERQAEPAVDAEMAVLANAVRRLTEPDRELLRLIAWDGLTTREAARVLGISHTACRVRLHRIRRRLARQIADQPESRPTWKNGVARLDAREES